MIRKAIFMMALCVCGQLHANEETIDDGTDDLVPSGINEDMLRQIEPTYLKEVAVPSAWSSNWFVGMSGGISTSTRHGTPARRSSVLHSATSNGVTTFIALPLPRA